MASHSARPPSEASASSSDFYDCDPVHDAPPLPAVVCGDAFSVTMTALPDTHSPLDDDGDDDDSSSEMDLSEPSRPATPEPAATAMPASTVAPSHAGVKRKISPGSDAENINAVALEDPAKRRRISSTPDQSVSGKSSLPSLPAEIWQRIFLHLPPAMLCRCLRVCKDFNLYLTGMRASPSSKKDQPIAQVMDSEAIWTQSRKMYFPLIPRPLAGLPEHGMLKLIGGRTCQFCGRSPSPITATSHLNAGPGINGMRVVWPFRIRTCGPCLEARILKDVQVLSDPRFGSLRLGVPHAYRSPDLHFASESVRQLPGGIPANLRFSKVNYIPDLEAVRAEEEDAKTLGNGAADEWRKGLAARGKEAMADSARWEKWELQLRPGSDLVLVLREYDTSSFHRLSEGSQSRPAGTNGTQPPMMANGTHPLPQPVHVFPSAYAAPLQPPPPQVQPQPQPFFLLQHPRPVRNLQEVELARQNRRADIERRCRELEPPLEPNVLQHMESFQAAMQIATPMTEAAWEMLKPRILAQREAAELAEHERASQLAALRATLPSAAADDFLSKPARDLYDIEYEQTQEPLRKRLGEYADDFVNGHWNGGKLLDRDNVPIFATQVITHVQRRYVEDKDHGLLPRFETPKRKGPSTKQGSPPLEPFLSLDNMKWIYDNKVRPLTDVHRRELFICAECPEEKKPKWFAFEGLIQHYGAKHTTAFSKGNIVVHWQSAEWPNDPPFHANPAPWLRPFDRRISDNKPHGRARNNAHSAHDRAIAAPQVLHLPQNPYHSSNGVSNDRSACAPTSSASSSARPLSNGYHHLPALAADPKLNANIDVQQDHLASNAREVWDALDGIQDFEDGVRMHTVLHHATSRFVNNFQQQPTLDMLTNILTTDPQMRPLKNANGLICKSCVAENGNGPYAQASYWMRIRGAKLYNTSALIAHFRLVHLAQDHGGYLDWTRDMMELPEHNVIKELLKAPGMDDGKLALIAHAFPGAFPTPLPRIGTVAAVSGAAAGGLATDLLLKRLHKKPKQQQSKKKGQKASNGLVRRDDSQEPLPEPAEDEYDPRRPMFIKPQARAHSVRSESDSRNTIVAPISANSDFTPEVLAALQRLRQPTEQQQQLPPSHSPMRSRSPSVGRQAPSPRFAANASVMTSANQPDIASILAALTGQGVTAETAKPPMSANVRAVSTQGQASSNRYHDRQRAPLPEYYSEPQCCSAPYVDDRRVHHDLSAVDSASELQAALSRNMQHHEQNQQYAYVEAPSVHTHARETRRIDTHVTAPTPTQIPSTTLYSPPRYRYAYEDDQHHSQPQAHAPVYREQEPSVHYVQLPEREQLPHGYHYERAPRPIFVDQYGQPLELIPIDAVPAPVQYTPSHYAQPHYEQQTVYTSVPPTAHLQPVYDDRRHAYYTHSNGVAQRYGYDDGRTSVPRS